MRPPVGLLGERQRVLVPVRVDQDVGDVVERLAVLQLEQLLQVERRLRLDGRGRAHRGVVSVAVDGMAFGDEVLVRNAAFGVARKFWFQSVEEEHFVCAFVFGHDGTARLQFE